MHYTMYTTPLLSSEPSSRSQSPITSPRASTSAARPQVSNHGSALSTIVRKINAATDEYWSAPSPLYTPRASTHNSRATTATTPPVAELAFASSKKEKKAGILSKIKRAIDRNTEAYWREAELVNAFYASAIKA